MKLITLLTCTALTKLCKEIYGIHAFLFENQFTPQTLMETQCLDTRKYHLVKKGNSRKFL